MRIVLFWSFYDEYVRRLYHRRPDLLSASFSAQIAELVADSFGWPPAVSKRVGELGHEVLIIPANIEAIQRAWAREAGVVFDEQTWRTELPLVQIERFNADLVWIGSMFSYYGAYTARLRERCRKLVAWIACQVPPLVTFTGIDHILTHSPILKERFLSQGIGSSLAYPAFEPHILERLGPVERDIRASFVGSLTWTHRRRIEMLRQISAATDLRIFAMRHRPSARSLLRPQTWAARLRAKPLMTRAEGEVFGLDMYRVLARSVMTINVHAEGPAGTFGNMRTFEATGAGALLFTEAASGLETLFDPDREVVTYSSPDELISKLEYFERNPDEGRRVAEAGHARVMREHSTPKRATELADFFVSLLNEGQHARTAIGS